MNKINHLFDEKYVRELFEREVLPMYPDFVKVKKIKIHAYKKHIWEHTYHVVIEFKTSFETKDGKVRRIPIICSAHSDEPRKNVYTSLKFLWSHNFGKGYLTVPHPLFYSEYFSGTFYRGVEGNNLYHYIRERDLEVVEDVAKKAALWFNKLHTTSIEGAQNFNEENSRIETVFPGIDHILQKVKEKHPELLDTYTEIYKRLNESEKKFLNSTDKRWLVHGDAHPENIIKMGRKKIGVIDFTDLSLSDFARDIGTFLQQLEYMTNRKIADKEYTEKIKNIFLDSYFGVSKEKLDDSTRERIDNYYNWTAIRTSTFFLLKYNEEPERGKKLLYKVCQGMGIECDSI